MPVTRLTMASRFVGAVLMSGVCGTTVDGAVCCPVISVEGDRGGTSFGWLLTAAV